MFKTILQTARKLARNIKEKLISLVSIKPRPKKFKRYEEIKELIQWLETNKRVKILKYKGLTLELSPYLYEQKPPEVKTDGVAQAVKFHKDEKDKEIKKYSNPGGSDEGVDWL